LTYATLKSDIANYLARDDLTSDIPTMIRLAESLIRNDVRVMDMVRHTTMSVNSQRIAMPDGFLSAVSLHMDAQNKKLDFVTPYDFYNDSRAGRSGSPEIFTTEGSYFLFAPHTSETIFAKLTFYQAYDRMSGEGDTNWLLENHYDVYLYASLAQAKAFIEDDEQAGKWAQAYTLSVDKLHTSDRRGRFSGAPMKRKGCPV